ncbi:hypothetical protein [Ralstonia solanacearum]|uniref:hypothetical protein n=1 Tax=Ralstonia solanacearum TaxID=305 RepID=UPI001432BA5C|nr:hypothetical protein [Ralstonia solanacearum]NKA78129.1 hypothetical protein [Ralstonia solanacearum]
MSTETALAVLTALGAIAAPWIAWHVIPRRRLIALCDGLAVVESRKGIKAPIEVRFAGEAVPQVTRTLVYVWNGGNRELRRTDISAGDPVRVKVSDDSRILAANVIRQSHPGLEVSAAPYSGRERLITFERLPVRHGAIVEVYHTALSPELELIGAIQGDHRIRNTKSKGAYFDDVRKGRSAFWFGAWVLAAAIVMIGGMWFASMQHAKLDLVEMAQWLPMVIGEAFLISLLPDLIAKLKIPRSLRMSVGKR